MLQNHWHIPKKRYTHIRYTCRFRFIRRNRICLQDQCGVSSRLYQFNISNGEVVVFTIRRIASSWGNVAEVNSMKFNEVCCDKMMWLDANHCGYFDTRLPWDLRCRSLCGCHFYYRVRKNLFQESLLVNTQTVRNFRHFSFPCKMQLLT